MMSSINFICRTDWRGNGTTVLIQWIGKWKNNPTSSLSFVRKYNDLSFVRSMGQWEVHFHQLFQPEYKHHCQNYTQQEQQQLNWHKEYEGINTFSRRRTEIHPVWGHWGKIKSVHPPPTHILYLCSPHRRHERGTKSGNLVLQKINQRSFTITEKAP